MARKRKKMTISAAAEKPKVDLTEQIKKAADGLWYMSETDAEIFPFTGSKADSVTKDVLLTQMGEPPDAPV
jgi:hypothetical protein